MKNLRKVSMLLFVVLALMVSFGCSESSDGDNDNDGNSSTFTGAGDFTGSDFDYMLMIGNYDFDTRSSIISITSMDENIITDCNVSINGEDVELLNTGGGWIGDLLDVVEGETYVFKVTCDNKSAEASLKVTYIPNLTAPETFDFTQATPISWSQGGNNQYQFITGYYESMDYNEDLFIEVDSDVREYTLPANWMTPATTDEYTDIEIYEFNFSSNNDFLFISSSFDMVGYGIYRNNSKPKSNHLEKIIDIISNN